MLHDRLIIVKNSSTDMFIQYDKIIRLEAQDKYIRIISKGQNPAMMNISLSGFLKKYGLEKFIKVHRSHAINIDRIKKYHKNEESIEMEDGIKIPLSRRLKSAFKRVLYICSYLFIKIDATDFIIILDNLLA